MRSGTSGLSSTISRGSGRGTSGTCTRPAPSRPRAELPVDEPELRTDTERPLVRPDSERDRRPDTERRDFDDCDEVRALRPLAGEPPPLSPLSEDLPPASDPADPDPPDPDSEPAVPRAPTTGARPHVSQYSSPPPTSS
ncbi:hypothetical protein WN71_002480 [Streptomyces mangrovisoli]|uniref:Uncharacterized protein n=1 Tax=Streptomyces mangrovisoli TaxID=1428628 RepID=A0A1J4P3R3_9ACTN|nr:hypothetical protein WN71_002480 [Streptomyces mangrovisoli]